MRRKLVLIDARTVGTHHHSFSRYVKALGRGLSELRSERGGDLGYEVRFLVTVKQDQEAVARELSGFETALTSISYLHPSEIFFLKGSVHRAGANLYHSPTYSSVKGLRCPWVTTVHDLNHLVFGGWKQKLYYNQILKPFCLGAAQIVTVSDFSRQEMARWLEIDSTRIAIAPNALDPAFGKPRDPQTIQATLERHGLGSARYLLCISNPKPHKNFAMLAQAYQKSGVAKQGLRLVTNVPGFSQIFGIHELSAILDGEMVDLMAKAQAVFFPSLYEGAGMPPLESAALGTPIVISDIAPHREGLSDVPASERTLLDPRSEADWVRALHDCQNGRLPAISKDSSAWILMRYSAKRLGENMDRIYRSVLGVMK